MARMRASSTSSFEQSPERRGAGGEVTSGAHDPSAAIEAHGGSVSVLGFIVTWDGKGRVTSVTPPD